MSHPWESIARLSGVGGNNTGQPFIPCRKKPSQAAAPTTPPPPPPPPSPSPSPATTRNHLNTPPFLPASSPSSTPTKPPIPRKIFESPQGKPYKFRITGDSKNWRPNELKRLVETNGGLVAQWGETKWDFRITEKESQDVRALKPQLITDSIQAGQLKNPEDYKWVQKGLPVARVFGTRNEFTKEDDDILYELFKQPNVNYAGRVLYQNVAKQHPHHTWQSWRHRAMNHVAPIHKKVQEKREEKKLAQRNYSSLLETKTTGTPPRTESNTQRRSSQGPPRDGDNEISDGSRDQPRRGEAGDGATVDALTRPAEDQNRNEAVGEATEYHHDLSHPRVSPQRRPSHDSIAIPASQGCRSATVASAIKSENAKDLVLATPTEAASSKLSDGADDNNGESSSEMKSAHPDNRRRGDGHLEPINCLNSLDINTERQYGETALDNFDRQSQIVKDSLLVIGMSENVDDVASQLMHADVAEESLQDSSMSQFPSIGSPLVSQVVHGPTCGVSTSNDGSMHYRYQQVRQHGSSPIYARELSTQAYQSNASDLQSRQHLEQDGGEHDEFLMLQRQNRRGKKRRRRTPSPTLTPSVVKRYRSYYSDDEDNQPSFTSPTRTNAAMNNINDTGHKSREEKSNDDGDEVNPNDSHGDDHGDSRDRRDGGDSMSVDDAIQTRPLSTKEEVYETINDAFGPESVAVPTLLRDLGSLEFRDAMDLTGENDVHPCQLAASQVQPSQPTADASRINIPGAESTDNNSIAQNTDLTSVSIESQSAAIDEDSGNRSAASQLSFPEYGSISVERNPLVFLPGRQNNNILSQPEHSIIDMFEPISIIQEPQLSFESWQTLTQHFGHSYDNDRGDHTDYHDAAYLCSVDTQESALELLESSYDSIEVLADFLSRLCSDHGEPVDEIQEIHDAEIPEDVKDVKVTSMLLNSPPRSLWEIDFTGAKQHCITKFAELVRLSRDTISMPTSSGGGVEQHAEQENAINICAEALHVSSGLWPVAQAYIKAGLNIDNMNHSLQRWVWLSHDNDVVAAKAESMVHSNIQGRTFDEDAYHEVVIRRGERAVEYRLEYLCDVLSSEGNAQ
ncbi:hypothetical protein SeLEV6574_g03021 [Synchytrium endobioticum]|uniref:Uncharacterized protein n=1 Tax=Synchytrium endobioticum TaxID=286115 RepID=A0A507D278_9FUNG|nr:hypothetical protein SeLEV6574_g03805 [Synchytrium endobioticum]TPX46800.1 hypothetical protein SeLEV6574_g03021 [Synchytrium endobioticum]